MQIPTTQKRVFKVFEIKNFSEYHNLYVQIEHHCLPMYLKTFQLK